ncbi:MAG TPA: hypothetical protein VLG11_05725 [Candidatus Saccharimonadales bacterium]|nr:hypothetical protein [Candidatus Saccharimonadales bacterium]
MEQNSPETHGPQNTSTMSTGQPVEPTAMPGGQMPASMPPATAGAPQKRGGKGRLLLIIGVAVVAIAIIGIIVSVITQKKPASKSTSSDSGLVIERPGYSNVADNGSADPFGLTQVSTGKVVSYQGQNIIQACSVLTLQNIRDAGFLTSSSSATGPTTRTFFDGVGAGSIIKGSDLGVPFDQDTNSCIYKLEGTGSASVSLYQSSYVNMDSVNTEIHSSYDAQPDSNGFKVYLYHDTTGRALKNSNLYMVTGNGIAAQVIINTPTADTSGRDKLMNIITTNMAKALSTPTPLLNFTYKSPIFTGSSLNACDLTDNLIVKSLFNKDASPLVDESEANSIGLVVSSASGKKYNYTESSCTRRTPAETYLDASTVRVDVNTYETLDGAKELMAFDRSGSPFSKNIQNLPTTVGDESFFGDVATSDNCLVFRKGRAIVYVTFNLARGSGSPPASARIQVLTPIAQYILANKMKDFQ